MIKKILLLLFVMICNASMANPNLTTLDSAKDNIRYTDTVTINTDLYWPALPIDKHFQKYPSTPNSAYAAPEIIRKGRYVFKLFPMTANTTRQQAMEMMAAENFYPAEKIHVSLKSFRSPATIGTFVAFGSSADTLQWVVWQPEPTKIEECDNCCSEYCWNIPVLIGQKSESPLPSEALTSKRIFFIGIKEIL